MNHCYDTSFVVLNSPPHTIRFDTRYWALWNFKDICIPIQLSSQHLDFKISLMVVISIIGAQVTPPPGMPLSKPDTARKPPFSTLHLAAKYDSRMKGDTDRLVHTATPGRNYICDNKTACVLRSLLAKVP